ncbi:hypothetical protein FRX31_021645 [Thalictrum thalictroides]|uniref:Uncharacterized protein n=1 Tax=Thalictrum thalictroides TaxID=46969 RepID=A0A7J6VVZ8_THATH|nr:hypothetical protein FRX31_021645 [Thalictrum thalictroides]
MDAQLGILTCLQRSCGCAGEGRRCVIDTLDLSVDRRIEAVCFPSRRGRAVNFRSSPELRIDSPVYRPCSAVVAASTVKGFSVTAETNAVSLKSLRPPHVRSSIAAMDSAGDRTICLAVGLQLRRENVRSCPELKTQSPVYGGVQNTVPPATAEIPTASELRKSLQYTGEGRCVVDTLDLATDRRITGVCSFPLRRRRSGDGFRSSPEFGLDSPVYSCPGLRSRSPVSYDGVDTVQPAPADIPQKPAKSERRKSAWTRSRRFVWKGLVNAARRLCCCRSSEDTE